MDGLSKGLCLFCYFPSQKPQFSNQVPRYFGGVLLNLVLKVLKLQLLPLVLRVGITEQ